MGAKETKSIEQYRSDYDTILSKLKAGQERIPVEPQVIKGHIQHYVDTMDATGYRQWEDCRQAFKQARRGKSDIVQGELAQKLAQYLIRFKMKRGNRNPFLATPELLTNVVSCILSSDYDALFDLTPEKILDKWSCVKPLCMVATDLSDELCKVATAFSDQHRMAPNYQPTMTMITKILMGTYATVPAFDQFLVIPLHAKGSNTGHNLPVKHIVRMAQYYVDNADRFQEAVESFNDKLSEYSPMRLVDMVMWGEGKTLKDKSR